MRDDRASRAPPPAGASGIVLDAGTVGVVLALDDGGRPGTTACNSADGIDEVTSARWAGDIESTSSMMLMTVVKRGTVLSGFGGFSTMLVPGSTDTFTISGTLRTDTLNLLLTRRAGENVHFVGWYLFGRVVLTGHLTGGEFYDTPVTLVKQ